MFWLSRNLKKYMFTTLWTFFSVICNMNKKTHFIHFNKKFRQWMKLETTNLIWINLTFLKQILFASSQCERNAFRILFTRNVLWLDIEWGAQNISFRLEATEKNSLSTEYQYVAWNKSIQCIHKNVGDKRLKFSGIKIYNKNKLSFWCRKFLFYFNKIDSKTSNKFLVLAALYCCKNKSHKL